MVFNSNTSSALTQIAKHSSRSSLQTGDRQSNLSSTHSLDFRSLGRASSTKNFGTLSSGDDESKGGSVGRNSPDFFKFRIKEKRKISLDVTIRELISSRYIRGSLLNSNKHSLKSTNKLRAPFGSDDFSTRLKPGTYYVKISTDGNKIYYNFKLSVD